MQGPIQKVKQKGPGLAPVVKELKRESNSF
jgi:hypothetical protein